MRFLKSALKQTRRLIAIGFTLLTAVALAQNPPSNACTAIIQAALQAANDACSSTSRNQVCYGNVQGDVTPADGVTDLTFEAVGDIAGLVQIKSLQLSPLNEEENEWGVALMQLQANLPDTLPGQNVTFLLFGDASIEQNTGEQVRVDGTAIRPSNMRLGPSTTGPVVGSLANGAAVVATGKTTNSAGETWVRVRNEEYRTRTGWVFASLLEIDLDALPDVPTNSLSYNPMQAFYFKTGIGQSRCTSAPVNGVVVQTPQGAGRVNFNVNGIEVALGSTAFINAPDGSDDTCLSLITGSAEIRSKGETLTLYPGEKSCTVVREDGTADRPGPAQPFDPAEIAAIAPIFDSLPIDVEIPNPAPTRTPTPRATAIPPTQFVPTPTPTNTEFPGGPTNPPAPIATATKNPTSTPTNVGSSRFASASLVSRNGFDATFTASAGPDAPSSFTWDFGDGSPGGGQTASHTYAGGNYAVNVMVCWSDGECIPSGTGVNIPPCAVNYTLGAPVTIVHGASSEIYEIFKSDEFCSPAFAVTTLNPGPPFNGSGHVGETWSWRRVSDGTTNNMFFIADQSPYTGNAP